MKTQKLQTIKVVAFCGMFMLFMANCDNTQTNIRNKKGSTFRASIDEAKQLIQGWQPSEYYAVHP